jgi:cell division protein FtsZ
MINLRINSSGPTEPPKKLSPRIKVIGVGGAGGNAFNNMINSGLEGVEFIVCNTDAQALEGSLAQHRVQLGLTVTGGMGAGSRPDIGKAAAEETQDEIAKLIDGANMVFITAGMGGGTGTGAAPVIAKLCRDLGVLTVGVVTKPFQFEGSMRLRMADQGIEEMQDYVDTLIVIPNQNLFRIANEKTTFAEAFKLADSVLQSGVRGITDLIVMPGLINLDFADVRSIMTEMGKAVMGTGEASGDKRALEAAEKAISNPLLDDVSMKGSKGVIVNVTGGYDMTLYEVDEACNRIRDEVDPDANIIFGSTFDESLAGTMRVSVVATGIDKSAKATGTNTSGNVGHVGGGVTAAPVANTASSASASLGTFGKLPERSLPKFQAPAAPERRPAPIGSFVAAQPSVAAQPTAPVAPVTPNVTEAPVAPATGISNLKAPDMFAGIEAPKPAETAAAIAQAAVPTQSAAPSAPLRGTLYKDSFIPPKPAEADPNAVPTGNVTASGPAYNPAATTSAPAAYEPSPLTLTRPVAPQGYGAPQGQQAPVQPTYTTPLPSVAKGPAAATQLAEPRKKGPGLLQRLSGVINRGRDEDDFSAHGPVSGQYAAPSAPRTPPVMGEDAPSAQAPVQAPVAGGPVAGQGALDIETPVKKPQANFEDELDIPAFLRRQAN